MFDPFQISNGSRFWSTVIPTWRGWQYLAACVDHNCLLVTYMEISSEERPVPALPHCLASASGFCGFCAIWDAKTIMVYHHRCKIIISLSWYLYIIMVKPSLYIIKARQQSSCLLHPFKHPPKRIEQLQTGKFMVKHHLYHPGTTCLFCLGAIWMFFYWRELHLRWLYHST